MKKVFSLLLAAMMLCSVLTGCSVGGMDSQEEQPDSTEQEDSAPVNVDEEAAKELQEMVASSIHPITGSGRACTTTVSPNGDYTIACIVKNNTNPACMGWMNGVEKACEDMGIESILMTPSTNDSVEEQIKIIEDMIQRGVDAIAIAPVDSEGITPGARKAYEAGIPVASMTTPCAEYEFAFVGPVFYDTGYAAAQAVAEQLEGKGKIIILEGPAGAQNAIDRLQGINDALSEYPDIEIVASQTGNFKRTEGMQVTENLIQKFTDVDAIIALNDEMACGSVQALKAANLNDVLVVGFDCNEDASNAIKSGDMWGSFNMDHFGIGYAAAVYLVMNLEYGIVPNDNRVIFPDATVNQVITSAEIDEYIENLSWF